ncbi:hypothetical protein BsWGS_22953 [Bradybaena similaris]
MDFETSSVGSGDFYGFNESDIEVRENESESEIDASDISVSSVNTSDLSDFDESDSDISEISEYVQEESVAGPSGDAHGWKSVTSALNIERFIEETGPVVTTSDRSQLGLFLQLFEEQTFQVIVDQTNEYARRQMEKESDRAWFPTTVAEMKAYFGLLIIMGIHSLPRLEMYWSSDERLGVPGVNKVMPFNRFKKMEQYLHVVDNSTDDGSDRLHKIRPLINITNRTFLQSYKPRKDIAIDEAMVPFKGRTILKQYLPAKPTKWGMKVWCACESATGYLLQFSVYCGKKKSGTQHGLGHDVVMQLAAPFLGKYHHLYFDNFFSSVSLMTGLLREKTYAAATVRKNRKDLPLAFKDKMKMKQGDHVVFQKEHLIATVWHDKRDVFMLSTNTSHTLDSVQRWDRQFRDRNVVPCPAVIRLYNQCMGGVDKADQMRGYYSTLKKCRKYWRYLLCFVFDSAVNNAFILFEQTAAKPSRRYSLLDFRLDLSEQLIAGFCSRKKATPPQRKSQVVAPENIHNHKLVRFEGRAKACVACLKAKRRTPKGRCIDSSFGCDACQLNYCKDTCFPQHIGAK